MSASFDLCLPVPAFPEAGEALADCEGLGSGEGLEVRDGCGKGDADSPASPSSFCDCASSDVMSWALESALGEVRVAGDSVGSCVSDGEYVGASACSSPCSSWGSTPVVANSRSRVSVVAFCASFLALTALVCRTPSLAMIEHDGTEGCCADWSRYEVTLRSCSSDISVTCDARYVFASPTAVVSRLRAEFAWETLARQSLIAAARGVPEMFPLAYRYNPAIRITMTPSTIVVICRGRRRLVPPRALSEGCRVAWVFSAGSASSWCGGNDGGTAAPCIPS